ncbi:hypothetical protein RvY_14444-2 [Ramazzottius varieornatus]|uniref:BPL/LPL catalytic domain-containing protein n=1 Tax=Ramazzottius varieornatus TaxID=947166 RepID=A0A1D1VTB9_RAMVA|nr:hypothetical protein RvY_14444-2 [Ramazzottius varieornatus]
MSRQWRVLISKSHNIYLNLAWEDWLYRNFDFTKASLLLMWRNTPCVVIGRYQNPWKECNVSMMADAGILLARRHSGGGTVYHDMGNLNFSFMTERNLYNRKTNLHFIVKVLQDVYGIRAVVSPRDDIVVNEKLKVSGTAAKLGRKAAYHHCTLLCNVEKEHLRAVLKPNNKGIQTTASESVPSPTVNLAEIAPALTCEALMNSYKKAAYRDLNGSSDEDALEWTEEVLPTEEAYHGVTAEASKLETKDFVFGNTPKFKIARDFEEPTTKNEKENWI